MRLYELFIIAVSLSMDAFAVSICKGLSVQRPRLNHCLTWGGGSGPSRPGCPSWAGCWGYASRG